MLTFRDVLEPSILKSIPIEKLQQYFEQWELKLTKYIAVQEDYF